MQKAAGVGQNALPMTLAVLTAFASVIAAFAGWITKQTSAKIHEEVNSKSTAQMKKLDDTEKRLEENNIAILALTKELATLKERDEVARVAAAVAAAAPVTGMNDANKASQ